MVFKVEADVRAWLRAEGGDRVFWVEPGRGGTVGLPDCLLAAANGCTIWLEVKLGQVEKGLVRARLRPAQRITLRRAAGLGLPVGILVGIQGTERVIVIEPGVGNLGPKGDGRWRLTEVQNGCLFGKAPVYGAESVGSVNEVEVRKVGRRWSVWI